MLLPALIVAPLRQIAQRTAACAGTPTRAERFERNLGALAGRLLAPGGWAVGARHADAEPLWTGRERPYDESTLRHAAREMSALDAVAQAEQQLEQQVHRAVGTSDVHAFTDLYDQVYWTKKSAWAGPVGSLGNRKLACTYFGLTFVRTHQGPLLAYHLSWHKPASPLRDALESLHESSRRHRWLNTHVQVHVLDRGTQGDPTLHWAWSKGIPYLTLSNRTAQWRRFQTPTHYTEKKVPIFVRHDPRLDTSDPAPGRTANARVIIFPTDSEAGVHDGRALYYRTAAVLTDAQVTTLDQLYKERWPSNEHPIKSLVAVGFDRNLDRTLDATTSRGHDGEVRRRREQIAAIDDQIEQLMPKPFGEAGRQYAKLLRQRAHKQERLTAIEKRVEMKGARSDRGGEHLCKLLALLLLNALAMLLWRSPIEAVRVLTPARVRDLLLSRSATVTRTDGTLCLVVSALHDPTDRACQEELVRLFNRARLSAGGNRLTLRMRDPPAILQELRIAA